MVVLFLKTVYRPFIQTVEQPLILSFLTIDRYFTVGLIISVFPVRWRVHKHLSEKITVKN